MAPGNLTAGDSARNWGAGVTTEPAAEARTPATPGKRRHVRGLGEQIGLIAIYGLASVTSLILGLIYHHKGFEVQPPPGQIYVMAFTQQPDAAVSLLSNIYPRHPWLDRVKVDATVSPGRQVPWLLVVQCPHAPRTAAHAAELYSQTGGQMPGSPEPVAVYAHTGPFTEDLSCFAKPTGSSPSQGHSIANVSLPALETDAAIAASPLPPTVYTERSKTTGKLAVMQVFPDLVCPSPSIARPAVPAHPAGQPTACRSQTGAHILLTGYHTPVGVQTTEVLSGVTFSNFQLESVFPVPQREPIGGSETFTWTQSSSVDPTLQVADTGQQHEQSQDTFYAGVFFGIFGAAVVAFVERVWRTYFREDAGRRAEAEFWTQPAD